MEQCIARANLVRCYSCIAFPFIALAAYAYKIHSVGDDFYSYLSNVKSGGTALLSAGLFVGGSIAWIVIAWPKARLALSYSRCAISVDEHRLWLYEENLERADIATIKLARRLFDLQLRVERKDGSNVTKSVTLLSPSPQRILERLRQAVG